MFLWDSHKNIIYPFTTLFFTQECLLLHNVYVQCVRVLTCLQALVCALADISSGDRPISNQRPTLKSIPGMHSVSRSTLWLFNTVQKHNLNAEKASGINAHSYTASLQDTITLTLIYLKSKRRQTSHECKLESCFWDHYMTYHL